MSGHRLLPLLALALSAVASGCGGEGSDEGKGASPDRRPAILLVTLDTTRADAVQPEATAVETPTLAALAERGLRFTQAYATAPQTLPSHASMLTGLYPAGHGLHENGRRLAASHPVAAEGLAALGYRTAAFVSGFPLDRQFGLARGFATYDDAMEGEGLERGAAATTDRALAFLDGAGDGALFLWVHYYDPHDPYAPPEPYASRYADAPYLGEIAHLDAQLGRLLAAFEERFPERPRKVLVAGDHGEGLGDHGEALHGNLLYQGVMRVPLVIAGSGVEAGVRAQPVSVRQVHDTILGWARLEPSPGFLAEPPPVVLAEAMTPYLLYAWQPQVMGVRGTVKAILSGDLEVYDLAADPAEARDLAATARLDTQLRQAVREYPLPSSGGAGPAEPLTETDRQRLASLGYVPSGSPQRLRPDAPVPRRMTHLFADLDLGSGLFVRRDYGRAIPVFERILAADPGNLTAALRLAVAHSALGEADRAMAWFRRAAEIDPTSLDRKHYLAMHLFSTGADEEAAALFEAVLAAAPQRLPALEALARVRQRQGRPAEAAALLERVIELRPEPVAELVALGGLRMEMAQTGAAIAAFERARGLQGDGFGHHLELGVLYLAAGRPPDARDALDRVPPEHPGHAMALFKRAQVSVLLGEADRGERIRAAWRTADAITRPMIRREQLFAGYPLE
jgi:arylsulfatase A-like enzyme/Tfp pilus assembly protein PilF